MNYQRVYVMLIEKRRENIPVGYSEKHHVIPRALGGDNSKTNIVRLTGREHFVAHWLLARIHGGRMWSPIIQFKKRKKGIVGYLNSRAYEEAKKHCARILVATRTGAKSPKTSGKNHWNYGNRNTKAQRVAVEANRGKSRSPETRRKIGDAQAGPKNHAFGKTLSAEHRKKLSDATKGRHLTDEHRAKIVAARAGYKHSEETKRKISKARIAGRIRRAAECNL